jgi:hypothetical protein
VALITVPTTNTTITSAWGKSVADAINADPFLFGGLATFTTGSGGFFEILFPATLPWVPTYAVLTKFGTGVVDRVAVPCLNGFANNKLTGIVFDSRAIEAASGPAGWTVSVSYLVGRVRS